MKHFYKLVKRSATAALSFILVFHISQAVAGDVLWSYLPKVGYVDASPAVGDVDDDGTQDIIIVATSGRVSALNANGRLKWSYDVRETISSPPTLAGEPSRVYVVGNSGRVVCLAAKNGVKLWEYKMPSGTFWGMTAIAAADMNGDGALELIIADRGGHLVCLNQKGELQWKTKYKKGFNAAPAVADLDGDGVSEILLGAKNAPLVCFSNKGKEKWRGGNDEPVGSSPVVYDVDGDGAPEILLGEGDGLSVYDAGGVRKWHYSMKGQVHDAIAVGDVDQDNKLDIVVVDLHGEVACLNPDGKLKWTGKVGQRVRRSPAIADIDGDSTPEVIVGGYAEALSIFDGQGNLKEQAPLHGGMNASPTIVDFRGDGRLSVVCATTSDVVALTWMPKRPGVEPDVQWAEYRLNSARTGSPQKTKKVKRTQISAIDYGDLHVGVNTFQTTVENPKKQTLTLHMEIRKNGERPMQSSATFSDSLFSLRMPYSIIGQSAVNLEFQCRLLAGKKLIAQRRQQFYLVPFAKDVADLRLVMTKIQEHLSHLADDDYADEQAMLLGLKLRELEEKTKIAGTLSSLQRAELRTQFEQVRAKANALEAMTRAAVAAGSDLAVYAANPWAPFGGSEEIVEGRTNPPALLVEAFAGETESAAVNLANFSGRSMLVRVEPQDLLAADSTSISFRQTLAFHEVLDVPTHTLDLSADALPRMNEARTIMLPPWSVRQVWMNIDAGKLSPGEWTTLIRFRTLETAPKEAFADLRIKVWPIALSEKQSLRLCHWGYVHTSILKDMPDAALADQVRHGTNVFVATNAFAPRAQFDENGELGPIDFSAHDEYVRRHSPHGLILFFGYQHALKGPGERFSETWRSAYKKWIAAWVKHLQDMGLSYEDFAFYPIDEPGLREGLVDDYVAYAKPIRELDANIQLYTDPVGRASMADLEKMAPFVDIWCPNRNGFLLHDGGEKLDFIKSTGATVWTYECEGDAKHQSPLGYYRAQSWLVWRHGLSGIGFWSYCTSVHDPWYVPRGGQDYLLIYQGDGVVSSKRWEAVRDGIEDHNLLVQLQNAVDAPPANASPEVLRAAGNFLGKEAAVIGAYCGLDDDGTKPGIGGLSKVRRVEDRRWQTIKQARRRMAELLLELQNTKAAK